LQQYYDFGTTYPPDVNYAASLKAALGTTVDPCMVPLMTGYTMADPSKGYDPCSVEVLYYYLNRVPQSRAVVSKLHEASISAKAVKLDVNNKPLPSKVFDPNIIIAVNGKKVGLFRVVDAWNMPLRYIRRSNDDKNFPLLRSAGPDRKFGTDDDIVNKKN
jgi:hypothetical protein